MKRELSTIVTIVAIILIIAAIGILKFKTDSPDDCLSIKKEALRDTCYAELGILRADINVCDKAENQKSKFYCYEKIAEATNVSALCYQIKDEYWADICFNYMGAQTNNHEFCIKISNDNKRDACFNDVAKDTSNEQWCQQIIDYPDRVTCFSYVGKQKKTAEVCANLGESEKSICIYNVAVGLNDTKICEKIAFSKMKKMCMARIGENVEPSGAARIENISNAVQTISNSTQF